MDLTNLRQEIDTLDAQLCQLLTRRMTLTDQVGAYKLEHGIPVLNAAREREILERLPREYPELRNIYAQIFECSRARQSALLPNPYVSRISQAIKKTPSLFPAGAQVACQGVEGAYSMMACERLFEQPQITWVKTFGAVFAALDSGLCQYGIVPVENSTAGSVKKIYSLLQTHQCYIVRSTRLKINHALLGLPGAERITRVYSHEQALSQCAEHLSALGVTTYPCANTAQAAQLVAESGRRDWAALASARCAPLYGLTVLEQDMNDSGNNHTRFLCVGKQPEVYPGSNRTTLGLILPHRPGSLAQVLNRMYARNLNVLKLESIPLPEKDFEFGFYMDVEASMYSDKLAQMLGDLQEVCEEITYFGTYLEVV